MFTTTAALTPAGLCLPGAAAVAVFAASFAAAAAVAAAFGGVRS